MFAKKYLIQKKREIVILFLILTVISSMPTLLMFFQQKAIDNFSTEILKNNYILYLFFGVLAFFILKLTYSNIISAASFKLRNEISDDLISSYVRKTAFNRIKEKITLAVVIDQYLEGIIKDYYIGMLNISSNIIIALSSYIYAFFINKWIAVVSIVFMIINLWINRRGASLISEMQLENAKSKSYFLKGFKNILANYQIIKTNNMKAKADDIFDNHNERFSSSFLKLNNKYSNYLTINAVYYAIQKYSIIVLSVFLFFSRTLTAGELISCIFLASFLSAPLIRLGEGLRQIASTKRYREEIERILKPVIIDSSVIKPKDKGFSYYAKKIAYEGQEEKVIFRDININIEKGKKYLILGKNGSGKSTLLSDLTSALINSCFSGDVGVVFQNESLMKGSIKDNIQFFNKIDGSKIKEILEKFKIEKDINQEIENGSKSNLSRGEIQRVLLARHIANDKNILILDEAINGVEKVLQREILEYILKLEITVIMVSHKLEKELIGKFDEVFLIKDSNIIKAASGKGSEELYEKYLD